MRTCLTCDGDGVTGPVGEPADPDVGHVVEPSPCTVCKGQGKLRGLEDDLRDLAELVERQPTLPWPGFSISLCAQNAQELRSFALAIAPAKRAVVTSKGTDFGWVAFNRQVGAIRVEAYAVLDKVCTRRKVGTRIEPAKPAEPEREVGVYEWDCSIPDEPQPVGGAP